MRFGRERLCGQRIFLREICSADYVPLGEILNHVPTMHHLAKYHGRTIWSQSQIQTRFDQFHKDQVAHKALYHVVIDRRTGQIVGNTGLKRIDRRKSEVEFGIILHGSTWGTGIAQECFLLCLAEAFDYMKLRTVYFQTDEANQSARKILAKMGVTHFQPGEEGLIRYNLKVEDWPQTRAQLQVINKRRNSA